MSADFGADLDAALKGHLEAVRAAAAEAKRKVDESVAGLSAGFEEEAQDPAFAAPPGYVARGPGGPAVDFDLDESPLEFDSDADLEGVPLPEEI